MKIIANNINKTFKRYWIATVSPRNDLFFRPSLMQSSFLFVFLLNILCLNHLSAQTFKQEDFNRLINNLPVMKNYDKETGLFKGTVFGERYDLELLLKESNALKEELKKLESEYENYQNKTLFNSSDLEKSFSEMAELDRKKKKLKDKITYYQDYIMRRGYPSEVKFINVIDNIAEQSIKPLFNENSLVLNKLPKYVKDIPQTKDKDLRHYFYSLDEKILKEYLSNSYSIGLLFKNFDNVVLYQNEKNKSNKIAKIDFSKILALHPKMSLFDFDRFGFYKIDKLNLSKEDFENELNKYKKSKGYEENCDITNLDETREKLNQIETEAINLISDWSKKNNYDLVLNTSTPKINNNEEEFYENSGDLVYLLRQNDLYFYNKLVLDSTVKTRQYHSKMILHYLTYYRNPKINKTYYYDNLPVVLGNIQNIEYQLLNPLYKKYHIDDNILSSIKNIN